MQLSFLAFSRWSVYGSMGRTVRALYLVTNLATVVSEASERASERDLQRARS